MLNVLLESRANGERRRGGTVASVVLHTALIVGAVVATATGTPAPRVIEKITPIEIDPPMQPVKARVRPPTDAPSDGARSGQVIADPVPPINITNIPIGIPPVSDVPRFDPGVIRPPAGAFDPIRRTGPGGASGTGGVWVPDAVEVLATLLPHAPSPAYPDMLRRAGVTGRVVVRFVVDTTGRVELPTVTILASAHDLLEQEVRRVLPRYRFRPAEVGGAKVRMLVELPFEFNIR